MAGRQHQTRDGGILSSNPFLLDARLTTTDQASGNTNERENFELGLGSMLQIPHGPAGLSIHT